MSIARLPAHVIRRLAVEAHRDPRSVQAVIDGRARPSVEEDVRAAADRLGIVLPSGDMAPEQAVTLSARGS
jgi:hypothetical protein